MSHFWQLKMSHFCPLHLTGKAEGAERLTPSPARRMSALRHPPRSGSRPDASPGTPACGNSHFAGGGWGSAPSRVGVSFVGSCYTGPHTARRVATHRSMCGSPVSGSIRIVPHTHGPGGARHLVGQRHAHHFRRFGRHHPLQSGRCRARHQTRLPIHCMAPVTSSVRRSRCPILVMAPGYGAVHPCCALEA